MTGELDALREARTYREIVTHLHPGELGLLTRDEANAVITLARSALASPATGEGRRRTDTYAHSDEWGKHR